MPKTKTKAPSKHDALQDKINKFEDIITLFPQRRGQLEKEIAVSIIEDDPAHSQRLLELASLTSAEAAARRGLTDAQAELEALEDQQRRAELVDLTRQYARAEADATKAAAHIDATLSHAAQEILVALGDYDRAVKAAGQVKERGFSLLDAVLSGAGAGVHETDRRRTLTAEIEGALGVRLHHFASRNFGATRFDLGVILSKLSLLLRRSGLR